MFDRLACVHPAGINIDGLIEEGNVGLMCLATHFARERAYSLLSIQLDRDRLFMIAEEALEDGRKRFFLVAVSYGLGGMVGMGPYVPSW